ncbi:MAG TPA: ankyrin repeat domain-containing protein [Gaiellaceae bacterium]|jgi:ankyrin repeat protein
MPTLPDQPDLDQLRRQAKELLHAAQGGDPDATARLRAVSERVTLAAAQLALAREYGFASWPGLKHEVDARTLDLAQKVDAFCEASIGGRIGRAARLLDETPAIAGYNLATAVLLGDADRVDAELRNDPTLATRPDPRTGWTALHAACSSRWYQLDPALGAGLLAVARLLLDAGADPVGPTPGRGWVPLRCAIAVSNSGPSNRPVVELLLDRGAVPDDHDLYLAGFAHDRHELLPLLLARVPSVRDIAEQALAAPISNDDAESVRLLLEAGADPERYRDDDGRSTPAVWAALRGGCSAELVELLLVHGADPNAAGPDGRTPHRLATAAGRRDLADLLLSRGADDTATAADRFLSACRRADRAEAQRQLDLDPGLLDRLSEEERTAIVQAAEAGDSAAVTVMLDVGFGTEDRGQDGATPLHAAAYTGSADTARLLLDRGADLEARDTTFDSTPLGWAAVGSGERPRTNPAADWVATVRILLERGASPAEISLDPDDPKPPSGEVADLLRVR